MSDLPLTIPKIVERAAQRFGDREAVVDGDVRLSFTEFADEIGIAARAFVATGVEPGDRVSIWAPNMYEWAVAALGAHCVGGVVIPLEHAVQGERGRLRDRRRAGAAPVHGDRLPRHRLRRAPARVSTARESIEETIVLRGAVPERYHIVERLPGARRGRGSARRSAARAAAVQPEDLCDILFTSGTTGAPKGAMLFHSASIRAFDAWSDVVGLREGDRYLVINPFFHTFGLKAGILACLMKGATLVPHPIFDVPSVMRRVAEERITMLPGPPAIFQTILNHPDLDEYDLSTLRLSVTGAAPITTQMIIAMREKLGFENVVTGYGLTEAHGIATMCRHDDDPETIAKTSGRAIPGVEITLGRRRRQGGRQSASRARCSCVATTS